MASLQRKLKKRSSVREEGLYALEAIMGECCGHGCGFGGEDIDWTIGKGTRNGTEWWKSIEISLEKEITVSVSLYWDDDYFTTEDVLWAKVPKKWRAKLVKLFKAHLIGRIPVGLEK